MNPVCTNQINDEGTLHLSAAARKLLPEKVRKSLPSLGSTSQQSDPTAMAKFFTPDSSWTWYAIEFDGLDTFYGLVDGAFRELGTFSLSELLSARGHLGLPVERDRYFEPTPLSKLP